MFARSVTLAVALGLLGANASLAQNVAPTTPNATVPFLTLDQDRLFAETLYGQRVLAELDEVSRALAERNRQITAVLTEEEKSLTEQRAELGAEEFRALADAFDEKVTALRAEQDARIRALQRQRETERRRFNTRVAPALMTIVREVGAVAVLDERAVILSADQFDMTDRAIARVNEMLSDGTSPVPDETEGTPPTDGNGK